MCTSFTSAFGLSLWWRPSRENLSKLYKGISVRPVNVILSRKGTQYMSVWSLRMRSATCSILMVSRTGRRTMLSLRVMKWGSTYRYLEDWVLYLILHAIQENNVGGLLELVWNGVFALLCKDVGVLYLFGRKVRKCCPYHQATYHSIENCLPSFHDVEASWTWENINLSLFHVTNAKSWRKLDEMESPFSLEALLFVLQFPCNRLRMNEWKQAFPFVPELHRAWIPFVK